MECMACSDNVVRAGLTPKYRDVHTLCEMLDYTGKPANKTKFPGKSVTENGVTITTFSPPIRDFAVKKFQVIVMQVFRSDTEVVYIFHFTLFQINLHVLSIGVN